MIYPALEQAYLALRTAKARAKHVVLLSDGRTYPDDHETLVHKMADANITVSSVAVGPSADQELLRSIAHVGPWAGVHGRGPEGAAGDLREGSEERRLAVVRGTPDQSDREEPGVPERGRRDPVPPLKGFTSTVMKDSALEILATPDDDPLLAFWPVGLGLCGGVRVGRQGSLGRALGAVARLRPFFSAVVHAIERQRPPLFDLDAVGGPIDQGRREIRVSVTK